jgi:15-cis-phytoene synthase
MNEVQTIVFAYAPRASRDALSALWACDAALGRVVATTTEPMIGQMRLTWWHERLTGLDAGEAPAEPVLAALRDVVRLHDVTGAMLAGLVEGWEVLLDPLPLSDDVLRTYADKRGDGLFALSARVIGRPVIAGLGAGWALIDFATHCSDQVTAERAWAMAGDILAGAGWTAPKPLRILSLIAKARASAPFAELARPVSRWAMLRAVLS